jgi:MFS family permease
MASAPQSEVPTRRGYPLGTLFVLVAISAVLTAGLSPAVRAVAAEKLEWWQPLLAAGIGAVALGLVGVCAGGFYFPHWRGLLTGGIAGFFIGLIAGPLALVQPRDLLPAALAMCVGSVISVGIAAAMRRKGE